MAWLTFGTATSPEPMSALDTQFNNVASGMELPCTASGTNAISLTPLVNFPSLPGYNELGGYRFVAVNNSSGLVTLQYNGLGFLPVYHADGVTQANVGDILTGQQYIVTFHQALNAGGGGFFFLNASTPLSTASWNQPGGRLTLQSATPVMFTNQTSINTIWYAPYQHPFCPIYNGSVMQNVQFTTSLSDQVGVALVMGGAANFPTGAPFDLFLTLIGGVPKLVATAWTNLTTRATTLSIFGGVLTNSGSMTAQTGANTSATVPINQGTFLGTMIPFPTQGLCSWIFGAGSTGGTAAQLFIANYYNPVNFVTDVVDNGVSYTYTSNTVRSARGSSTFNAQIIQPSSERAVTAAMINGQINTLAVVGAFGRTGVGFLQSAGVPTSFNVLSIVYNNSANISGGVPTVYFPLSFTGYGTVWAMEQGDGVNANGFNAGGAGVPNTLAVSAWL